MEKLFGRAYESIGSTGSDFIIKTKGQVKIQWGNKFIDIVKNGKIAVDTDIIESINSISDINKNGIYYIKETGSIYIYVDGTLINLSGEIGTTYVSFVGVQETTDSQKKQALANIGLMFETLDEAIESNITDGFVYILNSQKFYIVSEGKYTEYPANIPNPYPRQFVIKKEDSSTNGSFLVYGDGKINGININDLFNLYQEGINSIIEGSNVIIRNNDLNSLSISSSGIESNSDILSRGSIIANEFKSENASPTKEFRLYINKGESTLEVDNIIWRNKPIDESGYIYPSMWFQQFSTIASMEEKEGEENIYSISFRQPIEFSQGNILCTYSTVSYESEDEGTIYEDVKIALSVIESTDSSIDVNIELIGASSQAEQVIYDNISNALQGKKIFFVANGNPITRLSHNNIDLLNINSIAEEEDINNIKTRIGSIQDLNFTKEGFNIGTLAEGNIGIYSDNLVTVGAKQINSSIYAPTFKASPNGEFPKYDSGFNIPVDDDSKTVVTSEWVNDKTDKRLEEYVRKDQLISLIESYIQPVDGTRSNPVTLVAGTIRRATNSTTDWYFIGGKKARITDVQVTVKDGLMTITLVPASGSTINVLAVSAVIGDTGEFNGDFSITSRGGRGAGAHWCNAIPDPNTSGVIRVREYHQANDNNDSWGTANWNYSNGPISLSFAAFGYIVG